MIVWCRNCKHRDRCDQDILCDGKLYHIEYCSLGEEEE